MLSTFTGIEIGKRGLISSTVGLDTIGHNLDNASTDGYSRERVELSAAPPLAMPGLSRPGEPGQLGQGVEVSSITRIRDQILEGRIVDQNNTQSYWEQRDKYLQQVEQLYNEPTDKSVRTMMDKFWEGWQNLSQYPSDPAARQTVLTRSNSLLDAIKNRYTGLSQTRSMLENEIQVAVKQVNDLTTQIAKLNDQIVQVKAEGDNPNDLLDKRDLLVRQLSQYLNITTNGKDPDEFNIHVDGRQLVQGSIAVPLVLKPDQNNEGFSQVVWNDTGATVHFSGGKLGAFFGLRDGDIRGEIQSLDNLTINLVDLVNEVHRQGYGENGQPGTDFFVERPAVLNSQGNYDASGNGTFDHTYLYRFTGTNKLDGTAQIGLKGSMQFSGPNGIVTVDYNPTDTVNDIVSRINNSGSEVVARLDRNGQLELKATPASNTDNPDFVIRHVEDSGQFLVGYAGLLRSSGSGGAYDFASADQTNQLRANVDYQAAPLLHPAGWMAVNPAIEKEPSLIATGFGSDGKPAASGDGSAALAIAHLRNRPVMVGKSDTFDDYFANAVANIGLKGEQAQQSFQTQQLIVKNLTDMQQSISGVNVDEELANMIKFQHGYAAAARFVTTMDNMLSTLITQVGGA